MSPIDSMNRRQFLTSAGTSLLAAAAIAALPRTATAATPAEVDDLIKKLSGGAVPKDGKVSLKLPQIAENGNTVPFTVVVDSPMTADNYVKTIHILAEANPVPSVASFHLTPRSGKAEVSMRMRLAKTQDIRALAVMSDGSVHMAKQEVKVTIGGCGG